MMKPLKDATEDNVHDYAIGLANWQWGLGIDTFMSGENIRDESHQTIVENHHCLI